MKKLILGLLLLGWFISACGLISRFGRPAAAPHAAGTDAPNQVATIVADMLTQTALSATATTVPEPPTPPVISDGRSTYRSTILGIEFDYPDNWYLQDKTTSQPAAIILSSFDPANPPHKLEWTDQTTSLQLRLMTDGTVPQALDDWVNSAKQAAITDHLDIFSEQRIQIANQPGARLTLVSGSGGVIDQVLTILDGRRYEIFIEGNFDLARSVLDTLQVIPVEGLKPPDSDTPAAGICADKQGDMVEIALGAGEDGLPLAGRCLLIHPTQRIKLINQTGGPVSFKFAEYVIDLPVGGETVLDKPVGEYLAPGVHFLPNGPEIWLKTDGASP